MKKRVTIKDLAAKAKVSTGTIDRVLHNRGKVAPDVKKRVEEAIEELGYQRNMLASALAFNRNFKISVLLPAPNGDLYWEQVKQGVEEATNTVQHYGFLIDCHFFDLNSPDSLRKTAQEVFKKPTDGILFPPLFADEARWILDECIDKTIPSVIINTNIEDSKAVCYIGQDSYQSGVLAAQLLNFGMNHGETAILLTLDFKIKAARHLIEKENGFRNYFEQIPDKEIEIERLGFEEFDNKKKLHEFINQLIKNYPKLSGIFVSNSRAHKLVELLSEEQAAGLKIVGFDLINPNLEYLATNKINFLINQNPSEQGYLGIMNFFKLLFKKEEVEAIQYLPLDIVVKENARYYLKKHGKFPELLRL